MPYLPHRLRRGQHMPPIQLPEHPWDTATSRQEVLRLANLFFKRAADYGYDKEYLNNLARAIAVAKQRRRKEYLSWEQMCVEQPPVNGGDGSGVGCLVDTKPSSSDRDPDGCKQSVSIVDTPQQDGISPINEG